MGKQWKKDGKVAAAAKKGAIFTKLVREIQVAARMGGPDPESNSRLKMAVAAAQYQSCPKDTIERAIKKGSGQLDDASTIEELVYEGYGPHGVGIIVECQSDNKTRTVAEVRNIFKKNDGNLGETGAVQWMFSQVALVEGLNEKVDDIEAEAIEAGANDVEKDEDDGTVSFYGSPEDLDAIRTYLISKDWSISVSEISYRPKEKAQLSDEQRKEVIELLEALDDNDDTHRVYSTID